MHTYHITTIQFNLNLIFTRMWHKSLWTIFCATREFHMNKSLKYAYICTCHSRITQQIYQVTCKLHTRSEQICPATCKLHVNTEQICWTTNSCTQTMIWCTREVHYLRKTYYITCKMHEWPQHLWIRLQLTHTAYCTHIAYYRINYSQSSSSIVQSVT